MTYETLVDGMSSDERKKLDRELDEFPDPSPRKRSGEASTGVSALMAAMRMQQR